MRNPFQYKELSCGICPYRLLHHPKYPDTNAASRHARCVHRPELKQSVNSWPKWCLLRKEVLGDSESLIIADGELVKVSMLNDYCEQNKMYVFKRKVHCWPSNPIYEYVAVYANAFPGAHDILFRLKAEYACLFDLYCVRETGDSRSLERSMLEKLNTTE